MWLEVITFAFSIILGRIKRNLDLQPLLCRNEVGGILKAINPGIYAVAKEKNSAILLP